MSYLKNSIRKFISFLREYDLRRKSQIGSNFTTSRFAKIHILDGSDHNDVIIQDSVMLHGRLISQSHGKIQLGDFVNIRQGTIVGAAKSIVIGTGTIISNDVIIMDNNNHPTDPSQRAEMVRSGWGSDKWQWRHSVSKPIVIGKNVWIGQFARIGKGVSIGDQSIVAANAVVVHDVPPNSIVAGNPARVVKSGI